MELTCEAGCPVGRGVGENRRTRCERVTEEGSLGGGRGWRSASREKGNASRGHPGSGARAGGLNPRGRPVWGEGARTRTGVCGHGRGRYAQVRPGGQVLVRSESGMIATREEHGCGLAGTGAGRWEQSNRARMWLGVEAGGPRVLG